MISSCDCSTHVTRVLYSMSVDGMMTFPANDPQPSLISVLRPISSLSVYEGDMSDVYRVEDHYHVTLEGELVRSVKAGIESRISAAWSENNGKSPDGSMYVYASRKRTGIALLKKLHCSIQRTSIEYLCLFVCELFVVALGDSVAA